MSNKQPEPGSTPATVHILRIRGATYECRLVCCNKKNCSRCNKEGRMRPTHGPYWYLCYTSGGRTCRAYLGKDLDTSLYRDAHDNISIALIRQGKPKRSPVPTQHLGPPGQVDGLDESLATAPPPMTSLATRIRAWAGLTPKTEPNPQD